jgi:hypothetical protein
MANFAISIGLLSLQLSMGLPCIMFARKGYYNLVGLTKLTKFNMLH